MLVSLSAIQRKKKILNKPSPLLNPFELVLILWVLLFSVSFSLIVIRIFYFPTSTTLLEVWSFRLDDRPWTPVGTSPESIFRGHYFGDFQLGIIYSSLSDPYIANEPLPYGYPPVMHRVLNLLSQFPIKLSFIIYLIVTIGLTIRTMWILLGDLPNKLKLPIGIFGITTSLPLIMALDRGNFVVISICCGLIGYIGLLDNSKKNSIFSLILLSIAIDIKAYIAIFCIFLFLSKRKRQAIQVVLTTMLTNLVFSFFYESSPMQIIYIYIKGLLFYGANDDPLFPMNGNALVASVARGLNYWLGMDWQAIILQLGPYANVFGYIWLLLSAVIYSRAEISRELRVVVMLSCIQFFPPVSMFYTNVWSLLGVCLIISKMYRERQKDFREFYLELFVGMILIVSILPLYFGWHLSFSGLAWIIVFAFLLFKSGRSKLLGTKLSS